MDAMELHDRWAGKFVEVLDPDTGNGAYGMVSGFRPDGDEMYVLFSWGEQMPLGSEDWMTERPDDGTLVDPALVRGTVDPATFGEGTTIDLGPDGG